MSLASEGRDTNIHALINYEDPYVQPLILSAISTRLPPDSYTLITDPSSLSDSSTPFLQFLQYESIDFPHLLAHPSTSLANAYVIRKALIRKHYLGTTVVNWTAKNATSVLAKGVKGSVEFEVDYAEFLDDALVEAWELKESWERGAGKEPKEREWWILKPGMSDRGQGIRLFSNEEQLTAIFEEWDPESDDEEDEKEGDGEDGDLRSTTGSQTESTALSAKNDAKEVDGKGIVTSQLRHFIAQPYIHPPLLLQPPTTEIPSTNSTLRKFHIRTYVLATGALKVFVYKPMLALFAARPYAPPWANLGPDIQDLDEALKAHLTNTCLQDTNEREGSVGLFWDLPDELPRQPDDTPAPKPAPADANESTSWKSSTFNQICAITGEIFEAAARSMSIHFQPLPNAFEIFGLDFMVGIETNGELRTWLLEVNAFPDFRQTGDELKGVVEGLFEGVVDVAIKPFFGLGAEEGSGNSSMIRVLDIDLGRK